MTTPIPPLNMHMNSKFSVFNADENPRLKDTELNFDLYEVAVVTLLKQSIQENIKPDSFLFTFDSKGIKYQLAKFEAFQDLQIDDLIGSIWLKTKNFLNINLVIHERHAELKEEKEYQTLAVANMWSNIITDYSTHSLDECKQLPFYTVFTNRQAQVLLGL